MNSEESSIKEISISLLITSTLIIWVYRPSYTGISVGKAFRNLEKCVLEDTGE